MTHSPGHGAGGVHVDLHELVHHGVPARRCGRMVEQVVILVGIGLQIVQLSVVAVAVHHQLPIVMHQHLLMETHGGEEVHQRPVPHAIDLAPQQRYLADALHERRRIDPGRRPGTSA